MDPIQGEKTFRRLQESARGVFANKLQRLKLGPASVLKLEGRIRFILRVDQFPVEELRVFWVIKQSVTGHARGELVETVPRLDTYSTPYFD